MNKKTKTIEFFVDDYPDYKIICNFGKASYATTAWHIEIHKKTNKRKYIFFGDYKFEFYRGIIKDESFVKRDDLRHYVIEFFNDVVIKPEQIIENAINL